MRDVDVIATRAEVTALGMVFGQEPNWRGLHGARILRSDASVDVQLEAGEVTEVVAVLPDNVAAEFGGIPAVLVSALTDRIIKQSVFGLAPERILGKHRADVRHYKAAGGELTPAHRQFARFYRQRMVRVWASRQP